MKRSPWDSLLVISLLCHIILFLPVKNRRPRETEGEKEAVVTGAMSSLNRTAADAGMRLCLKLWA